MSARLDLRSQWLTIYFSHTPSSPKNPLPIWALRTRYHLFQPSHATKQIVTKKTEWTDRKEVKAIVLPSSLLTQSSSFLPYSFQPSASLPSLSPTSPSSFYHTSPSLRRGRQPIKHSYLPPYSPLPPLPHPISPHLPPTYPPSSYLASPPPYLPFPDHFPIRHQHVPTPIFFTFRNPMLLHPY